MGGSSGCCWSCSHPALSLLSLSDWALSGACGWTGSSSSSLCSRVWREVSSSGSCPVFLFLAESSGARGGPSSLSFVGASSSTRESGILPCGRRRRGRASRGQGDQPVVPIRRGRARARALFATSRPERAGLPRRRGKGSRNSFLSFLLWVLCKCLWEGACGE